MKIVLNCKEYLRYLEESEKEIHAWLVRNDITWNIIFHEKLSVPQVVCVILIVIGIAGLKILGKE